MTDPRLPAKICQFFKDALGIDLVGSVAALRTAQGIEVSAGVGKTIPSPSNVVSGTPSVVYRRRGWTYLGVSDHSQSAFYAGGLTAESLARQKRSAATRP